MYKADKLIQTYLKDDSDLIDHYFLIKNELHHFSKEVIYSHLNTLHMSKLTNNLNWKLKLA